MSTPRDQIITDEKQVRVFRQEYLEAISNFHREGKLARTWPLPYLIRHTAFHTMDHTWEMQDKDLR
jgi:hypothetical protein